MKIIIVGCGKVGTTLAEQLNRENHDITLIDTNEEAIQNIYFRQRGCNGRDGKWCSLSGTDGGRDPGCRSSDRYHKFR